MLDGSELARRHPTELLGRDLLGQPPDLAAAELGGRRILITGAGGSVGRPLAAALAAAGPSRLVLIDHHEASLWELHRRFGDRSEVSLVLADVRNVGRLRAALREARPEVVFHLAAYKHVPFGEVFADEAFGVNVLGTRTLLALAAEHDVERLIYPSSDKACRPPSLYGATKRLAETLVRQAARQTGRCFNVARFVNILGTQGSVIETFAQQVREGLPFTVTDARMTRYWIGMDEAIWLLLSACGLPTGGETLMLDAREEIAVVEMARRVCGLLRGDRNVCPIVYGSPRAGERLREELLSASETFEPGPRPGLLRVVDAESNAHLGRLDGLLGQLIPLAEAGEAEQLRLASMAAAEALQ